MTGMALAVTKLLSVLCGREPSGIFPKDAAKIIAAGDSDGFRDPRDRIVGFTEQHLGTFDTVGIEIVDGSGLHITEKDLVHIVCGEIDCIRQILFRDYGAIIGMNMIQDCLSIPRDLFFYLF